MKKPADGSPIVLESVPVTGKTADSTNTHATHFGSAGNPLGAPPCEWSLTDAIDIAKTLWGNRASTVVAWAALTAHCEGNMPEYQFWFEVFSHLRAGSSNPGFEDLMQMTHQRPFH